MNNFSGKVALVTGSGSGIGREIAVTFAKNGAKTIISDINQQGGTETVRMIQQKGGDAAFIQTDVSNAKQVKEMVAFAVSTYGRLDIACNNAGIAYPEKPLTECSEEEWDKIIDINLKGVWLCMKYQIPELLKQEAPAIVNTASVVAFAGAGLVAPYAASKHGVVGLTKSGAQDYARQGLRINAICPGITETPLISAAPEHLASLSKFIPMARMGRPAEIANAAVWLCSEQASYLTGHTLVVDGGFSVP